MPVRNLSVVALALIQYVVPYLCTGVLSCNQVSFMCLCSDILFV